MQIVFINYETYKFSSGVHIHFIANELTAMGHECTVVLPYVENTEAFGKPQYAIIDFTEFRKRIDAGCYSSETILHGWTPRETVRMMLSYAVSKLQAPYFIHLEDNERHLLEAAYQKPFAELMRLSTTADFLQDPLRSHPVLHQTLLAEAAGVTVLMDRLAEFVPSHVPTQLIWPACENTFFRLSQNRNPELRSQLNISDETCVLVYPGSVHFANKTIVEQLYRSLPLIESAGYPVKLIRCAGTEFKLTPELFALFHRYVLTFPSSQSTQLPLYMSMADVLVQPGVPGDFDDYRFPSKLPLFLASGRPVILPKTNLGRFLTHERNCLHLEENTPEAIARHVIDLIRNPVKAQAIGQAGRRFAQKHFTWAKTAQTLLEFYGKTCTEKACMQDITLITPCRNAVASIDDTIWSIVSQSGKYRIRYHVQDGGSTDGTVEKLMHWEKQFTVHNEVFPCTIDFSWSSEPDNGMYDAIAKAVATLDIPENSFMGWLNAGDTLWPGAIASIVNIGRERPDVQWIMGRPSLTDRHGAFAGIHARTFLPQIVLAAGLADGLHWPHVQQESTFWRKKLYDQAGGIDSSLSQAGDWDLWRRFARFAPLVHVLRPLASFRLHPGQMSGDLTVYNAEIESVHSLIKRRTRNTAIASQPADKLQVYAANQNTEGQWDIVKTDADKSDLATHHAPWAYQLILSPDRHAKAKLFDKNFSPEEFTFARRSHFQKLCETYITGLNGPLDIDLCDLKAFQDALCSAFIDQMLPECSNILEIGGGNSRVLPLYHRKHNCWNLDGLEGIGNGITQKPRVPYTFVQDYIGNFSEKLPEKYFDLVFSLSVLEHVPEDAKVFENIIADIGRVLKPGGMSFHLIDITMQANNIVYKNRFIDYLFKYTNNKTHYPDDIYYMTENSYNILWKQITKQDYSIFGQPNSVMAFWIND